MYSMLLMMAASTGGEAPAFHCKHVHGCCGGYEAAAPAGCCGGCCGGWGYGHGAYRPAYNGCCGGSGCCGGGCWGANYNMSYGGYGAGPAVTFTPYGSTNLNPPDAPEKATLRVDLPKDARLFVDGREIAGAGSARAFATPNLPRGQDFFYDLRAEVTVDGKTQVEEKRVIVRAGGTVNESFGKLLAAAPATGEKVASK